MKDFLIKGEKMKKIKEMRIGEPKTLINPKMFKTIEGSEQKQTTAPMSRSISLSFIKSSPLKKQRSEI